MHEFIEVQFRRNGKGFWLARQVSDGFQFEEAHPPTRSIELGFRAFDEGTKQRMQRIRQVKDWPSETFKLKVSVEDGCLLIRGDDEFSLPEGFYEVSANVAGAKVKKRTPARVEVPHDKHGTVVIDLEIDDRIIEVDLNGADPMILDLLGASTIDGQDGLDWIDNDEVSSKSRACALNLLANLRVFPKLSEPLLADTICFFKGLEDRTYAEVGSTFFDRVSKLSEEHDLVFPEGHPHAPIHKLLLEAVEAFDATAKGLFLESGLFSFRAEGGPSLQMVIATPSSIFDSRFVDLDLDLGNPLQDVAGLVVHIGELLSGEATNHLDLRKKLAKGKAAPFLYYKVVSPD